MSCYWYALQTKPRHEKKVAVGLRGRGWEEFLPLARRRRTWSDRTMEIDVPLFPSYVFCRLDLGVRLPVLTTPGVLGIVGNGRIPMAVDDQEIAALQRMVHSGLDSEPWPFLEIGQRVRIDSGPLAGCEGILLEFKGKRRLVLSVTLLRRSVAVEVDRPSVLPCAWYGRLAA